MAKSKNKRKSFSKAHLFDIKPVDQTGNLDAAKLEKISTLIQKTQEQIAARRPKFNPIVKKNKKLIEISGKTKGLIYQKKKVIPNLLNLKKTKESEKKVDAESKTFNAQSLREDQREYLAQLNSQVPKQARAQKENYLNFKKGFQQQTRRAKLPREDEFDFQKEEEEELRMSDLDEMEEPLVDAVPDFEALRNEANQRLGIRPRRKAVSRKKVHLARNPRIIKAPQEEMLLSSGRNPLSFNIKQTASESVGIANSAQAKKEDAAKKEQRKRPISFGYNQLNEADQIREQQRKQQQKVADFFNEEKESEEDETFLSASYQGLNQFGASFFERVVRPSLSFAGFGALALVLIVGAIFGFYAFDFKQEVAVRGASVVADLTGAKTSLENKNFYQATQNFEEALKKMNQTQKDIERMGGDALDIFNNLPFLSRISTGKNVIKAGNDLTRAGLEFSKVLKNLSEVKNPLEATGNNEKNLLAILLESQESIKTASEALDSASVALEQVKIEDLPANYQEKFKQIKDLLPDFLALVKNFQANNQVFLELLGQNGPRKYLLLFQNDQEMRATGGFIGSYGLIEVENGTIKNLLIDGMFNPDWQLKEDVIPPKPIQKISAGWSTHDANWFPDFPASAQKIAWFYEKTGGPTVDGIIAIDTVVLKKLLEVTGPIEMPAYNVVVTADNFVEVTQTEVEDKYDKELNQPKKILADLAPELFNRLFSAKDPATLVKLFDAGSSLLGQEHVILFSFDKEIQAVISKQGWGGEILPAEKDYLQVVNSNINGFKTDGVIDEEIYHTADIQSDGSIIDTVRIKRTHKGGDTPYTWWNQVNSDYQRVYVPKGCKLLGAKGYTRETVAPPLDYEKLGFKKDPEVESQEASMQFDEKTGTAMYGEKDKTVFANWVYVSPKESVEIEYRYLLPFKIDFTKKEEKFDTYSMVLQKQAGSKGSKLISNLNFADSGGEVYWQYPDDLKLLTSSVYYSDYLTTNKFLALILKKRE